jgi:hypothetical protein
MSKNRAGQPWAEGAVDAYTRQNGEEWKPVAGPSTVGRLVEAEIAAFG